MRRIHEKLQFDAEWLVTASTVAMLVLALLGVVMGLPRFSNTLSGWHKGIAWVGMPLIVLSPLTGLFLATSVSFASAPPAAADGDKPANPIEAVHIVGERHDLSSLVWLRPRGERLRARRRA